MKIKSPLGEYEYRVTGVRVGRGGVEVDGGLGQWETTMVVEPSDLAAWGRRAALPVAVVSAIGYTCLKLWRRVS
jgi:hypothetical protein